MKVICRAIGLFGLIAVLQLIEAPAIVHASEPLSVTVKKPSGLLARFRRHALVITGGRIAVERGGRIVTRDFGKKPARVKIGRRFRHNESAFAASVVHDAIFREVANGGSKEHAKMEITKEGKLRFTFENVYGAEQSIHHVELSAGKERAFKQNAGNSEKLIESARGSARDLLKGSDVGGEFKKLMSQISSDAFAASNAETVNNVARQLVQKVFAARANNSYGASLLVNDIAVGLLKGNYAVAASAGEEPGKLTEKGFRAAKVIRDALDWKLNQTDDVNRMNTFLLNISHFDVAARRVK